MNADNTLFRKAALVAGVSAAMMGAIPAQAEQTTTTGAPGVSISTAARLDFRIVINQFLRLRVGTNVPTTTIDQISFDVPALNVGDGTDITGTGGDATGGTGANVTVQSNGGQVTITATNNSAGNGLSDGAGNFIPYTEILTVATLAQLPAPTLTNAGNTTSQPTLNAGGVTNRTGVWNFAYDNVGTPTAGTYGTSANGGRVTYTAATP